MEATIVDLRYRMKDVLRAIDRGETVTVSYRGQVKATLMPASLPPESDERAPKTADQPFFGLWKNRQDVADPVRFLRKLRQPREFPGKINIKKRIPKTIK